MALGDEGGPILSLTKLIGVLHESGEIAAVELGLCGFAGDDFNTAWSGIGLHHSKSLRQDALVDEHLAYAILHSLTRAAVEEHNHSLAGGGSLVEQTGVGERHTSHAGNHGLIVHQGFKTALRNLGLVRSVGGVPAGVLEDVAHDDGGSDGAVVAHTDVALVELVLLGQRTHMVEELVLAHAFWQGQRLFETDGGRHSLLYELIDRFDADDIEHLLLFGGV